MLKVSLTHSRKKGIDMEDQDFLNTELRNAMDYDESEGTDAREEKRVFLHYHLAMLQALKDFQPCENEQKDMTLLRARVGKMITTTNNFLQALEVLPMEKVRDTLKETTTLYQDVGDLCNDCRTALPRLILAKFKEIRQAPR